MFCAKELNCVSKLSLSERVWGEDGSELELVSRDWLKEAETGEPGDEPGMFQLIRLFPYGCGLLGFLGEASEEFEPVESR